MSYECCKRITLNEKKNIIKVCVASSNVFPKTYGTYELCKGEECTFDEKLLWLFYDLQSGNIHITNMNDNTEKFRYAICKAREWLKENNIDSYNDLYCKKSEVFGKLMSEELGFDYGNWEEYEKWRDNQDKDYVRKLEDRISNKALRDVYGKPFEVFKKALYEEISGEYFLKFNNYYYISKLGRYDRGYSRFFYNSFNKLNMSYKKAYIVKTDFSDKDIEIVKAEI